MKKLKTMDKILVLMAVFLFVFTVIMIIIFCFKDAVPDVLIEKVFMCCVGEGGFMGAIQVAKVIMENREVKEDVS